MRINSANETLGFQPRTRRALLASPHSVLISAGRKKLRIVYDVVAPVEAHMAKASSTKSRTECFTPVATT